MCLQNFKQIVNALQFYQKKKNVNALQVSEKVQIYINGQNEFYWKARTGKWKCYLHNFMYSEILNIQHIYSNAKG